MDHVFRISRLMRLYYRHGGCQSETQRVFAEWPAAVRSAMAKEGRLSKDDWPFLAHYDGPDKWTVVSLLRIVWKTAQGVCEARYKDLHYADTTAEFMAELVSHAERGDDRAVVKLKRENTMLLLKGRTGVEHRVEWAPGGPFYGFWNVVRMLIIWGAPRDDAN